MTDDFLVHELFDLILIPFKLSQDDFIARETETISFAIYTFSFFDSRVRMTDLFWLTLLLKIEPRLNIDDRHSKLVIFFILC